MIKNYIKIFWKVLKRKKLYTFITLFGICFPLIILTLVVSFLSHITVHKSPQSNFDKVVCINRFEVHCKKSKDDDNRISSNIPYKLYINSLINLKTPQLMCFVSEGFNEVEYNGKKKNPAIRYVNENFWQIADYKLIEGRFFNKTEVGTGQNCAIIDHRTKEFYFGNSNAIGKSLKVGEKSYSILGIIESADITKSKTYGNIFLPISTNEQLSGSDFFMGNGMVLALLKTDADKVRIEKEIKQTVALFDKSQIPDCVEINIGIQDEGFVSIVEENIRNLFGIDISQDYIVPASIALVLFFFLLLPALNLIYINQSRFAERKDEIGLRKSFGSTSASIFRQFIVENTLITTLGGFLALILSYIILLIINQSQIIPGCYIEFNWQVFFISAMLWIVLSFLSGALPSLKVSKSAIIDSLQANPSQQNIAGFKRVKKESLWLSIEIAFVFIALFSVFNFLSFFGLNLMKPIGFNYKDVNEIEIRNNKVEWFRQDVDENSKILDYIIQTPYVSEVTRLDACNQYIYFGRGHLFWQ